MNDKMKWIIFAIVLIIALIAVNKMFKGAAKVGAVVGDTTDKFGITTPTEAKALQTAKAFNPAYYKELGTGARLITMTNAKKLAKTIYDARTLAIYTDDETIIGVFKQLKSQSQISFLADVFFKEYQKDLINYFYTNMENKYLVQLAYFINNLPAK